MKKLTIFLLAVFLISNCDNNKRNQTVTEDPFKSKKLQKEFSKFVDEVKLIETPQLPPIYTMKFSRDKEGEVLMLFLDLSFPTHIHAPINDSVVAKGICFFNNKPILIYDKIEGIGYDFYDTTKLNLDTLSYFRKNYDPELVRNNIDYPTWIYRIYKNGNLQLIEKTPLNKFR